MRLPFISVLGWQTAIPHWTLEALEFVICMGAPKSANGVSIPKTSMKFYSLSNLRLLYLSLFQLNTLSSFPVPKTDKGAISPSSYLIIAVFPKLLNSITSPSYHGAFLSSSKSGDSHSTLTRSPTTNREPGHFACLFE